MMLKDVQRADVERGQVVSAPGSINPVRVFESQVYVLREDEGGSASGLGSTELCAQFYFRTMDVTGEYTLLGDAETAVGAHLPVRVSLSVPVAIELGTRFAIRRGGRTIGAGVVTRCD
jgi:elongation factor Tu